MVVKFLRYIIVCLISYHLNGFHQYLYPRSKQSESTRLLTSSSNDFTGISYTNKSINQLSTQGILSLKSIRSSLIRQEETIIFALIERAQYSSNDIIYDCKAMSFNSVYGAPLSFLEWMLMETEKLHAKVRRYKSPEEHAFFPDYLSEPILPAIVFPKLLEERHKSSVNAEILRWYIGSMIPRLCVAGDDEQHGSSVLCDITVLQALSKRIHYGKFVAESKFLSDPDAYTELLIAGDVSSIVERLTNTEVERGVIRRAYVKASTYGQDITGGTHMFKVDPKLIADIYRDTIIPLTKDVEVRYLFQRVGLKPPSPETYFEKCRGPIDSLDSVAGSDAENITEKLGKYRKNC